jgi:hypothetical protein
MLFRSWDYRKRSARGRNIACSRIDRPHITVVSHQEHPKKGIVLVVVKVNATTEKDAMKAEADERKPQKRRMDMAERAAAENSLLSQTKRLANLEKSRWKELHPPQYNMRVVNRPTSLGLCKYRTSSLYQRRDALEH